MSPSGLYFRGLRNLQQLIAHLTQTTSFASADKVVLFGESAGGLATILHADLVKTWMPASVRSFLAVPFSGFFLDHATHTGAPLYGPQMRNVFHMQNVTSNAECVRTSHDASDCMFAANVLPHVETNIFVANSFYDAWQLINVLRMPNDCWKTPTKCSPAQLQTINDFGAALIKQVWNATSANYYLYSCFTHCFLTIHKHEYNHFRMVKKPSDPLPPPLFSDVIQHWIKNNGQFSVKTYDCHDTAPENCNPLCTQQFQTETDIDALF